MVQTDEESLLVKPSRPGDPGHVDGDRDVIPQVSEEVVIQFKADVGYFVLEFADRGLDAVPGAEQTVVMPYTVSKADLKLALGALRLVGGVGFIDDVIDTPGPLPAGVLRSYTAIFSPQLDDLPDLLAFDTKLLVAGAAGDDELSVQSIDQPTYVLGGLPLDVEGVPTEDDQDTININVQIGISGPEDGSARTDSI